MPRNMSFMLTTDQIINKTKTVTRRLGWRFLRPGDLVMACRKCQGIPKGGKIERLGLIRVISTRLEPLAEITKEDCVKEGFPRLTPHDFTEMFKKEMKCGKNEIVNRIEFEYMEDGNEKTTNING